MGGLFSRSKGRRGEQQLVLYLLNQRFTHAERILRQYQFAGQPDVKAIKDGKEYTFELKTYKNSFKSLYDFYYSLRSPEYSVVGVVLDEAKTCAAISTNIIDLIETKDIIFDYPLKGQEKIYKRILALDKKRGKADFLVLKDNNKARLFIRYWS